MQYLPFILAITPFIIAGISVLRPLWKQTDTKPQKNQRVTGQPRQPRDRKGRYATQAKAHQKHTVVINHMNGATEYFTI